MLDIFENINDFDVLFLNFILILCQCCCLKILHVIIFDILNYTYIKMLFEKYFDLNNKGFILS